MKRLKNVGFFLLLLSIISDYLMSKASLVGKTGMSLFYKEYNFLKVWWKGAMMMMILFTVLLYLHHLIQKKLTVMRSKAVHRIACFIALAGLYFTYDDFRHTLSHHLLGERFHIGVYLFWIGWIAVALFFLMTGANADRGNLAGQQLDNPDSV
ncbi:MAG: cytochrome d ubiquinol oxidase subunit II [Ginsengibacter sp.]